MILSHFVGQNTPKRSNRNDDFPKNNVMKIARIMEDIKSQLSRLSTSDAVGPILEPCHQPTSISDPKSLAFLQQITQFEFWYADGLLQPNMLSFNFISTITGQNFKACGESLVQKLVVRKSETYATTTNYGTKNGKTLQNITPVCSKLGKASLLENQFGTWIIIYLSYLSRIKAWMNLKYSSKAQLMMKRRIL